jgi:UDP-2,3-diacylglucosamine hydrolase
MAFENLDLKAGKKIYFASDFHLGTPSEAISFEREQKLIRWLDAIKSDAQCMTSGMNISILFLKDLFDFKANWQK